MSNAVPPSTSAIQTTAQAEEPQRDSSFWRYLGAKIGGAAISLVMVVLLGFFAFKLLPGDPVAKIARERPMSPEQIETLREQYGLNKPLIQQFFDFIGNVFTLNFGESYVYRRPVSELIGQYFWPTILLTGTAAIIAIALGLWLGQRAAWRHGGLFDRVAPLWRAAETLGAIIVINLLLILTALPVVTPVVTLTKAARPLTSC